jgi:hypothetical protein
MKLAGKTSHVFNQQNSSLSAGVVMQEGGASPVTTQMSKNGASYKSFS